MSEKPLKKHHDEEHLEKLTIKELREIAARFPHEKAILEMKKEELVAFIRQAKGLKDEPDARKHKPKGKAKATKAEVKEKIRALKLLKVEARESNDGKKAVFLRHQISRLKKMSRRIAAS